MSVVHALFGGLIRSCAVWGRCSSVWNGYFYIKLTARRGGRAMRSRAVVFWLRAAGGVGLDEYGDIKEVEDPVVVEVGWAVRGALPPVDVVRRITGD